MRSRPQRSAVHRHTVDRHLVETVVLAAGLVRRVSRPDLLLVAALLHDIGKVRGAHDHSVTGAELTRGVVTRWGFSPRDVEVLVTLVREHLTLIELATRRDHQDPATVDAAIAAVGGDREVFEMLLALTEADASAAGPAAWTDWRATLLDQLAVAVRVRLDGPSRVGAGTDDVPAERRRRRACSTRRCSSAVRAGEPQRAGHRHRRLAPARHHRPRPGRPVRRHGRACSLPRGTPCAPPSCAPSTASRSTSGTSSRRAAPCPTRRASSAAWPASAAATAPRSPPSTGAGPTWPGRRARRRSAPPARRAPWSCPGASSDATVLEVRAQDRPGMLHELGAALAGAGISVRSAHIATYAGQTLDTFYLTGVRRPARCRRPGSHRP